LAGIILPFVGLILPVYIWFTKKDSSEYANQQGLEMINFLINVFILGLGATLMCVLIIGILIVIPVLIFAFVMPIVASISCSKGRHFKYPLIYRFIR